MFMRFNFNLNRIDLHIAINLNFVCNALQERKRLQVRMVLPFLLGKFLTRLDQDYHHLNIQSCWYSYYHTSSTSDSASLLQSHLPSYSKENLCRKFLHPCATIFTTRTHIIHTWSNWDVVLYRGILSAIDVIGDHVLVGVRISIH